MCSIEGGGDVTWVCVLIDDLLMFGKAPSLDRFVGKLKQDFKIKVQSGNRLSYIGLDKQTLDNGDRIVAQGGCRKRILERFNEILQRTNKKVKMVSDIDVFNLNSNKEDSEVQLTDKGKRAYLSAVMSLMFLSRLTRYDMLFWNCYLATRCKSPNKRDFEGLVRLLKYLEGSGNWGIRFKALVRVAIRQWCDSAHALHLDGRGQMGICTSLGSGVIAALSRIIKMMTLSSTESEFYCMTEGAAIIKWLKSFIGTLGFSDNKRPVPKMYEDNNAAIWWSKEDMTYARTKHMMIKNFFVKEAVEEGVFVVISCDTASMNADMLTKPTQSNRMLMLMGNMGMERVDG